jgi:SSS family solute:Na+ symporter
MVGAILSSFNSALNSTATLFSLGVYQPFFNPQATEKQVVASGKRFGTAIALLAMSTAPLLAKQESIFGYLQKMNGLYFIPIFAVVLVGMLSKRVPAIAANIALLVGFAAIALGYFVYDEQVAKIHEFHFLGLVFVSLIALMLLIVKVRPRAEAYVQQDVGAVDLTPWAAAKPAGIFLVLLVVGIYVYFADFSILSQ